MTQSTQEFTFNSRRSPVYARHGICAASQPLAAQAGLRVLQAGGNAADAAVAAGAVMNVVAPMSTGVGGDMFALYYDAKTRQVTALNGSGRAPAALTLDGLRAQGFTHIPDLHIHAVSVPGTIAGWVDLVARHGRMSLAEVLAAAIGYAEHGHPVSPVIARGWAVTAPKFKGHSEIDNDYLPVPREGELKRLPGLAATFRAVAEGGAAAFYEGDIARKITETVQRHGGTMTVDDLKAHRSTWDTPIHTGYHGITVYECPPNGQGLAALQAMNIARELRLDAHAPLSAERLHLMVEAMRLAFADARQYIADPAFASIPINELLGESYARERRALVQMNKAGNPPHGTPIARSDTIYLSVVDGEGNACSFINSLYMGFGSGYVVPGTGIALQNRAALFSLDASHPNALVPGKRPYHTIIPGMALKEDDLYASFGVMGGFMQPQGHFQVMTAMLADNADPQAALDQPRWCLTDGEAGSELALEDGIPVSVMAKLADWGHNVRPVSGHMRGLFGNGQIIRRDPDSGVLCAGSDPRADGHAAGW